MKIPRKVTAVVLVALFSAGVLVSGGCTKYANPDDLQTLDEAKKAAVAAEKELDKIKIEHKKVAKELAEMEKELKATKDELKRVKTD